METPYPMSSDFTRTQIRVSVQYKPQLNDLIPHTFQLEAVSQVGERGGSHVSGLAPRLLASHSHARPMNKEVLFREWMRTAFLFGVLSKLESRGLLPSMMTMGSRQPNLRMQLVSNGHLAMAEAWGVGLEGFSSVTEQLKILWVTPGNTTQGLSS